MKSPLRKLPRRILNVLTLLGLTCLVNAASATNYYVNDASTSGDVYTSAAGTVGNPGTSAAAPHNSLKNIINTNALVPGDTIFVDAGSYTDVNINVPSTKTGFVIMGAGTTLTTFNNGSGYFMDITGAGVQLHKVKLTSYTYNTGALGKAISVRNCQNVLIKNVEISGCGASGGDAPIYITTTSASTSATLRNVYIHNNTGNYGGGVDILMNVPSTTPTLTVTLDSCTITNNTKTSSFGGGINVTEGPSNASNAQAPVVTINYSTINNNTAQSGGGIYVGDDCVLTITKSCASGNTSTASAGSDGGGGLHIQSGTISLNEMIVENNTATQYGGGIFIRHGYTGTRNFSLSNSIIRNNNATDGGGVYVANRYLATFTNCLFYENTASDEGGALCIYDSDVTMTATLKLVNCTVADNTTTSATASDIGGVDVKGAADAKIYNSIFRSNTHMDIDGGIGPNPTVGNCMYQTVGTITNAGSNQVGTNPLFVNQAGNDYRLQSTSTAINAGASAVVGLTIPTTDHVGTSRTGNPDIGCYESGALYPYVVNACSANPCTPIVSVSITNVTCMSGNNGALSASITGGGCGTGDTYSWTNGSGTVVGTTASISGLTAGTYTLTITTAVGAFVFGPYTVTEPNITLSMSGIVSPVCVNAPSFTITGNMAPSGLITGTGITNQVNGTATFNPEGAGVGGPYNITYFYTYNTVCTTSVVETITVIAAPTADAGNASTNICAGANVSIGGSPSGTGGTGTLTYGWTPSSGLSSTSNANPTAQPSSTQTYQLTVSDVNGCQDTDTIRVIVNANPVADAGASSQTICAGSSASLGGSPSGSGGTGALSYAWTPSGSLNNPTNANPSASPTSTTTYTLTVTDALNCSATDNITVNVNALPVIDASLQSITQTTCNSSNGAINGITAGGAPVIAYSWSNGTSVVGSNANLTNVPSGTYTLTVTDGNNCQATYGPVGISDIGGPVINVSGIVLQSDTCGHSAGSITGITVSGGSGSYNYEWSSASTVVGSALNLIDVPAGNYVLVVSDASGCATTSGPFTVNEVSGPNLDLSGFTFSADTCGQSSGSFSGIVLSAGTNPIVIEWSDGSTVVSSSLNPSGLSDGTYNLLVTDARGCTASAGPYTINAVDGPSLSESAAVASPEHCGQADGSLSGYQLSGGNGNVDVAWYNGATLVSNNLDVNNLSAGNYVLVISDAAGCADTSSVAVVASVSGPVTDASAAVVGDEICGSSNGSVTGVTVSGGSPAYVFSWTNGSTVVSTSQDLTGVPGGSYFLIVTDAFGCSDSTSVFVLNSSDGLVVDAGGMSVSGEACGLQNGSVSGVVISSGNPPYATVWYNGATVVGNALDLTNVPSGNYTLVITDANTCADTVDVVINDLASPQIDSVNASVLDETCNEGNGAVNGVLVNGGSGTIEVSWYNGTNQLISNSLDIASLQSGTYTLIAVDTNGCADTLSVLVDDLSGGTVLANADFATGSQDDLLPINVVANDQGSASTVTVLSGPNHGSVQSISGGVVNYMPNQGYYGQDSLYYSICDNFCVNRCDTALVVITIEQDIPIDIPNGFTPNGDGFNDFFFIVGLHQYPNNKITIFNRWGDKVFAAEPYQNNWDGTSSNTALKISGDKVVDGTYFFILDLGDGSEPITGFVELKTR